LFKKKILLLSFSATSHSELVCRPRTLCRLRKRSSSFKQHSFHLHKIDNRVNSFSATSHSELVCRPRTLRRLRKRSSFCKQHSFHLHKIDNRVNFYFRRLNNATSSAITQNQGETLLRNRNTNCHKWPVYAENLRQSG